MARNDTPPFVFARLTSSAKAISAAMVRMEIATPQQVGARNDSFPLYRCEVGDSSFMLETISFDNAYLLILQLAQRVVMLTEYIEAAMKKAKYEILSDDNTFYGYIPGLNGVYANAEDLETCRSELREVLEEWIMLSISRHLPLPIVDGIRLVVEEAV